MNGTLSQSDDVSGVRTVKLVRLRVGVFADGTAVGKRKPPSRAVHVVDIEADLAGSESVTAYCGLEFAPDTLVEVPWMTMEPHDVCRRRSPIPGMNLPRMSSEATTTVGTGNGVGLFTSSRVSIRVTAQWSMTDPVIYVDHPTGSEYVDLAISGAGSNDVIAHFQVASPLEILKAGHNLVNAGLDLAETLGIDTDQLKSVTPASWWDRDRQNATVIDDEMPGP